MQDRPTIDELLEAVANFLTDDVMKATTGRVNFHARVAANGLQMVRRELANEENHLFGELDELESLLDESRPEASGDLVSLRNAVRSLNEVLIGRIRDGDADSGPFRDWTIQHLKGMTRNKLVVTNPDWIKDE